MIDVGMHLGLPRQRAGKDQFEFLPDVVERLDAARGPAHRDRAFQ